MIRKGMKLYSILFGACPKCHQESMYVEKNPYKLSSTIKINDNCSHCGTKYRMEPSFFYGSMYVSYGLGVAFAVTTFVICYDIFELSPMSSFIAIIITLIVLFPVMMRLSRNIWINLFMKYDKSLAQKSKAK
ncbi:MAG: DUF983 domain-containing protein [Winogradskyella sp.]|uniref:DUF983 domain-containing protein n=1 Tax=Winogradskyella sp. TaxID=1883156 RepID=UPI0025F24A67|nr:DUF983 domain-containing protein [Winogradskyella sp.]NRB59954.1 DUF983 domain-containing protein [Winogradskyella sp.]